MDTLLLVLARHRLTHYLITAGAVLISLSAVFVFAQTTENASLTSGASAEQINAAMTELGARIGVSVVTIDQARAICNQEKYLYDCGEIGKTHRLYKSEELPQVNLVLDGLKGKTKTDLEQCANEECLLRVAKDLVQRIAGKNTEAAKKIELTAADVKIKEQAVTAAKEAGVDFNECRSLDFESAAVEKVRACGRLLSDSRIKNILNEPARQAATVSANLFEAESRGLFAGCGEGTADSCGAFCFAQDKISLGESAIPEVCLRLAGKVFKDEGGVQALRDAYREARNAEEYYFKRAENAVFFKTPDGQTIKRLEDVGRFAEEAGKRGDVEGVKRAMEFMAAYGFGKPEDIDFAVKMVEKVKASGKQDFDFDACADKPETCKDFIHEDYKKDYGEFGRFEEIMRRAFGFDHKECNRSSLDPALEARCREGTRKALPELKAAGFTSTDVLRVISEIERSLTQGEELVNRKDEFRQILNKEGGPGGCRTEDECRKYCGETEHGPECIAFGARSNIFKAEEATRRYVEYNQRIQGSQLVQPVEPAVPGTPYNYDPRTQPYPYKGNEYPGRVIIIAPGNGGYGVSPDCLEAIANGDFVKARAVCYRPAPIEPTGITPPPAPRSSAICPALPSVNPDDCRNRGGFVELTYSSAECGNYYECKIIDYKGGGEDCFDGIDNNGNGLIDTKEPSCYGMVKCVSPAVWNGKTCVQAGGGAEICGDGLDNDNDGFIDAKDYECASVNCGVNQYWNGSACAPVGAKNEDCADGKDNNGNGLIDGADPSCVPSAPTTCTVSVANKLPGCHSMGNAFFDGSMIQYVLVGDASEKVEQCSSKYISGCTGVNSGGTCSSNVSQSSCTSAGCGWTSWNTCQALSSTPENCSNGIDDDGDGWIDSADPTCGGSGGGSSCSCPSGSSGANGGGSSVPTYCVSSSNSSLCGYCGSSSVSSFTTSQCQSGGGGSGGNCAQYGSGWHTMSNPTICFDPPMQNYRISSGTLYSCGSTPVAGCSTGGGIIQEICSNGVDDDGDGLIDSADPNCGGVANQEGICNDFADNDNDGLIDGADNDCSGKQIGQCSKYAGKSICESQKICKWDNGSGSCAYPYGVACNENFYCDSAENYTSCPSDCKAPVPPPPPPPPPAGGPPPPAGTQPPPPPANKPTSSNVGTQSYAGNSTSCPCWSNFCPASTPTSTGTECIGTFQGNKFCAQQTGSTHLTAENYTTNCPGTTSSGSNCSSQITQTTCTSAGCSWISNVCYAPGQYEGVSSGQCSDGIDNDGDGLIDNADPGCSYSGGGCGSISTSASCQATSGCTWAGTYCYASGGGNSGSCTASENSLLQFSGGGCHYMSGNIPFNGAMTAYISLPSNTVVQCSSAYITGCSGSGSGGCGSISTSASCQATSGCTWAGTYCYASGGGSGGSCSCPSGSSGAAAGGSSLPTYCVSNDNSSLCGVCGSTSVSLFTTSQCQTSGGGGSGSSCPNQSALGTGCHSMGTYNGQQPWFDGQMTMYVYANSPSIVYQCTQNYIPSCTVGGSTTPPPPSTCGNNICDSGETGASCPSDCGYTPPPPPPPPPSSSSIYSSSPLAVKLCPTHHSWNGYHCVVEGDFAAGKAAPKVRGGFFALVQGIFGSFIGIFR